MFGQNPYGYQRGYQQSYGPVNALADILGAYMTKKNEDGAYADAVDVGAQADKIGQPQYKQNVPTTLDASQRAAQSLMPSQQLNNVADANELSPGLAQQKQAFANLDPNNSVLQAAKQYQQLDPSPQQNRQAQYDQFGAAKAANPEWYVGDTYVGTDEAAKAKAQAALPQVQARAAVQQQAAQNSQYKLSNPMQQEYGFQDDQAPKQLSYGEYSSQLKTLKAQAMKDLVQKHGLAMAEKVSGMVDSAIQDKLSAYGDQQDAMNQQAIAPYLLRDLSTPQSKQQALWALQEYNNAAKKMGKPGLDMTSMAQIIAANDVNISAKDVGGQVQYVATPKNAPTFNDGSSVKPIFAMNKSMTPDASANLQQKQYQFDNVSANTKYQTDHADARAAAAAAAKSASGGNKQDPQSKWAQNYELNGLGRDQAAIDQYEAADDFDKPKFQKSAEQAQHNMNQYWQISSGGGYDPDTPSDGGSEQPQQQDKTIDGSTYNNLYKKLRDDYGYSDTQAREYISNNFQSQ